MTAAHGWSEVRIGDLGRVVTGTTPPKKSPELFGDLYPFLTPSDMSYGQRIVTTERYISASGAKVFNTRMLPEGSIAFVCIGATIGKMCVTDVPTLTNQQINAVVVDEAAFDRDFVFYALAGQRNDIRSIATGAATPIINKSAFSSCTVCVPGYEAQKTIGASLRSFDDLIETNLRQIEFLEEMARLLYREWFVHFRFPGHENVELIDSELGPLPEGWEVKRISEVASVNKGLSYKGAHLTDDGLPMANLKCLAPSGGFARRGTKGYDGPFKERHAILPGDIVVANTDLTQAGNVIGSAGMVPSAGFENGGLLSHHLFRVRPDVGSFTVLRALQSDRMRALARSVASGTTVLGMRTDDFERFALAWPPDELLADFESTQEPLHQLTENLHDQNAVLREARDLLLPRLVSGELDVSELDLDGVLA